MNRKQFIALLVLVAVLGVAAWWHSRRQAADWGNQSPKLGQKLLGNFQVNDVAQMRIQQGTNELTLAHTNGLWRVQQRNGYPANFSEISQLLLKLRDLKIIQTEEVEPSQLPELQLAPPGPGTNSATLLDLCRASGKPIRTLWLGKQHMHESSQPGLRTEDEGWPDGRYVLTASNSTAVALISSPLNEVKLEPAQWLDKTFIKINKPQRVSVNFPEATNSWTLTRASETNHWKLADAKPGEKLDKSQASETADSFSSPSFEDVAANVNPTLSGLDKPTRVEIKTFDGFDYSLKIGHETNNNYYLTVHTSATLPKKPAPAKNEKPKQKQAQEKSFQARLKKLRERLKRESAFNKWVYLVPTWSVNTLLKHRSQLMAPKPTATATNTPAATSPVRK